MVIPKFAPNSLFPSLISSCTSHLKHANRRIMFKKGGNNKRSANGSTGPIDDDNLSVPKRYHRRYLQQEEVDFVNSGGASKYDVLPKKAKKKPTDKGVKENVTPNVTPDSKGPLDEDNLDVPKRYQRQLLQQVEVDLVNTGGASKYDLIPKGGGKKAPAKQPAKGKK